MVVRGVLACKWIDSNKTLPPVAFNELVATTVDDESLRSRIDTLVLLKKDEEEHDMKEVDAELMAYAISLADNFNVRMETFRPERNSVSSETLDNLLYDMVNR